jgi:hippurate hydrolase
MVDLLVEAEALANQMKRDRRWLHQHPECGYDLPETSSYVFERLKSMGLSPQMLIPHSGVVATAGDTNGPCYLLRADMDALPEPEQTDLPFASKNGRMHACGHDLHTAMLLGAAQLLKNHEGEYPGCVKLMFQPDEEASADGQLGCRSMIDAGVLQNPRVLAASGCHVSPDVPCGEVGAYPGTVAYSVDDVDVTVTGKACHGAQTFAGIDPINVCCHIHLALQELLAREVDPAETVVLSIGMIDGGSSANTIPDTCHMLGTLRTFDEESHRRLSRRIRSICECTAEAFGATATVRFLRPAPTVYNDPELVEELSAAHTAGTGRKVRRMSSPFSGSDDFGELSHEVPSAYFMLGALPDDAPATSLHDPRIVFDESVMPLGAAMHASMAWGWLARHAEGGKARTERR